MSEEYKKEEFLKHWTAAEDFKVIQRRYSISDDPKVWSSVDVVIWLDWVIKQFNLNIEQRKWSMDGRRLCALTLEEFRAIVSSDQANKFWIHLELLRKCGMATIPCDPPTECEVENSDVDTVSNRG